MISYLSRGANPKIRAVKKILYQPKVCFPPSRKKDIIKNIVMDIYHQATPMLCCCVNEAAQRLKAVPRIMVEVSEQLVVHPCWRNLQSLQLSSLCLMEWEEGPCQSAPPPHVSLMGQGAIIFESYLFMEHQCRFNIIRIEVPVMMAIPPDFLTSTLLKNLPFISKFFSTLKSKVA